MDIDMLKFSAAIRDQENWAVKRNKPEKRAEWHKVGKSMGLCNEEVKFVLDELEYYARITKPDLDINIGFYDMIWASERLLDKSLRMDLISLLDLFKRCPLSRSCISEHKHFNMDYNAPLCLMCPSTHMLDFNRTRFFAQDKIPSPEAALDSMGHGTCPGACEKWDYLYKKLDERHRIGWDDMDSRDNYHWRPKSMLPCEVYVDGNGEAKVLSYINNLHPIRHRDLYRVIEKMLTRMVALFEEVLTDMMLPPRLRVFSDFDCWDDMRPRVPPISSQAPDLPNDFVKKYTEWYHKRLYVPTPCGEFKTPDRPSRPYSLRDHRLQVVVKAVEYNLPASNDQKSMQRLCLSHKHAPNECIIATAVYCYDMENILAAKHKLMFSQDSYLWDYLHEFDDYPMDDQLEEAKEDLDDDVEDRFFHDDTLKPSLSFVAESVKVGKCICYSALYRSEEYEVQIVDSSKPATLKAFVTFLVNPATCVMSTAVIPPQQIEWLLDAIFKEMPFTNLPIYSPPEKGPLPGSDVSSLQAGPAAPMYNGSSEHLGNNNGQVSMDERGFQGGGYTGQQQQPYPPTSYSPSGPPPPPHGGGYPSSSSGGYPPASSYPSQQGGYPSQQGGYPPQQYQGDGYPPPSSGAPPSYGVYSPPGAPPQQQHQGMYLPPGTAPPPPPPAGGPPPPSSIRLPLINPHSISSGFTISMPEGLYMLARRPNAINKDKWLEFIRQLNEQLTKSPGSLTQGITEHWVINLATLGVAGMARDMYKSRVQTKAMELVECYNRAEFASWGIRVLLDALDTNETASAVYHGDHSGRRRFEDRMDHRMKRSEQRAERRASSSNVTLVLVISRSD
ncbi:hypothetical protein EV179_000972 [Coemansia sp. RSA 487]|nr:hypothetical protein EV179_000972 [Coemansia sp. RSA 487]